MDVFLESTAVIYSTDESLKILFKSFHQKLCLLTHSRSYFRGKVTMTTLPIQSESLILTGVR